MVGESGSGKTLTALSILRLVPSPPAILERGEVLYKGIDLLSLPEEKLRAIKGKEISMVFQDPNTSLNPVFKVGPQVEEVLTCHTPLEKKEAKERVLSVFEEVGLPNPEAIYNSYPHELSGGMKQRVIMAMALVGNPKVLIADEPTTALDVSTQARILDLLREEINSRSLSLLFITHDFGIVAELADTVSVMLKGYIVEVGKACEIFDNPLHPYTEHLINSMPGRLHRKRAAKPKKTSTRDQQGCPFYPKCPYGAAICAEKMPGIERIEGRWVRCWKTLF